MPRSQKSPLAQVVLVVAIGAAAGVGVFGWRVLGPKAPPAPAPDEDVAQGIAPEPGRDAPSEVPSAEAAVASSQPALDDPAHAWNEEGVELLEAGALEAAAARFRDAHEYWPEEDTYANNLAEALFRLAREQAERDLAEALDTMAEALAVLRDDGRRAELTPLRDRWQRTLETEQNFLDYPSIHFTFAFDGSRRDLLDHLPAVDRMLDRAYDEYGDLFGRRPVEEGERKIRVVFYRREGFDRVTGLGDWAGGVFDGTIRVPVDSLGDQRDRDRLETVLRHELMHAFVHFVGGGSAPAWLNEGLAQWIERPQDRRRLDVANARDVLRRDPVLFPVAELRGSLAAWEDQAKIRRAYAQALALVDHVAKQYGERLLFDMVGACDAGGAAGAEGLFEERFPGLTLDIVASDILGS